MQVFKGTFVTRDGELFVVPKGRPVVSPPSRKIEQKMLSVLFSTKLKPLADPAVATRCQTPKGLRSEFSSLFLSARSRQYGLRTGIIRRPEVEERCPRFDCLLLVHRDEVRHYDSSLAIAAKARWARRLRKMIECMAVDSVPSTGASVRQYVSGSYWREAEWVQWHGKLSKVGTWLWA